MLAPPYYQTTEGLRIWTAAPFGRSQSPASFQTQVLILSFEKKQKKTEQYVDEAEERKRTKRRGKMKE